MSATTLSSPPALETERAADGPAVEGLIARAFGPGRFVKAAERLREHNRPLLELSFVARQGGEIVGCVRMWPVQVGGAPAVLLGPFAVDPACRSQGLGAALIRKACEATAAAGHGLIVLVGDKPYFEPLGFVSAPEVRMPGPVDQRRVLVKALDGRSAADVSGPVTA